MTKPIIRYTGQLDSSPEQVRCINHLLEQPGTSSVWKVTIEPIDSIAQRMSYRRALIELLAAIELNGRSAIELASATDTAVRNARKALGTEAAK